VTLVYRRLNLLHEKHECNARHQPPVDDLEDSLVQGNHLLFAQIPQRFKTCLYLLRCDRVMDRLRDDFLEVLLGLDIVEIVVGHVWMSV
jgi:hypothetical protein